MTIDGSQGLVFDLGVSEGNDTAYYLAKGFQVISVEADPQTYKILCDRFDDEIKEGRLLVLNFAASDTFGRFIDIFVHKHHQAISGISKRVELTDDYVMHSVQTINWTTLLAQAGCPRYLKMDIEGNEIAFLEGMRGATVLPEFISVECYKFEPIAMLHDFGYRRFKIVDQNPPGGFELPTTQLEGVVLERADFTHASGPFGLDIFRFGDWLDFEACHSAWESGCQELHRTWFDCHAWKPN